MAAAARRWGAGLDDASIFVGRLRAPLQLPPRSGAPAVVHPEPAPGGLRLPAGDRALSASSPPRTGTWWRWLRRPIAAAIVYVTAEKLVRGARTTRCAARRRDRRADAGDDDARAAVRVAGDVRRIEIAPSAPRSPSRIEGDRVLGSFRRGDRACAGPAAWPAPSRRARAWRSSPSRGASAGRSPRRSRAGRCRAAARESAHRQAGAIVARAGPPGAALGERSVPGWRPSATMSRPQLLTEDR